MSIADAIKKSVLDKFSVGDLTTTAVAVTLAMAILMGLFIYAVYRIHSKSGFYNRGFNKTLAVLPLITAAIMLAMSSSLTISLGMVGALSIVRFRNAVKDSVDLLYLFWSISVGIIVGAGLFELSVLLNVAAAVLIFGLDLLPTLRTPLLLIVSGSSIDAEPMLIRLVREHSRKAKLRSRNVTISGVEWIIELQVRNETALAQKLAAVEAFETVQMMTHDGDVRF